MAEDRSGQSGRPRSASLVYLLPALGLVFALAGVLFGTAERSYQSSSCGSAWAADPELGGLREPAANGCHREILISNVFSILLIALGVAAIIAGVLIAVRNQLRRDRELNGPRAPRQPSSPRSILVGWLLGGGFAVLAIAALIGTMPHTSMGMDCGSAWSPDISGARIYDSLGGSSGGAALGCQNDLAGATLPAGFLLVVGLGAILAGIIVSQTDPNKPGAQRRPTPMPQPVRQPAPTAPPAGWYQDPTDPARKCWWDGVTWTAHVFPPQAQQASPSNDRTRNHP